MPNYLSVGSTWHRPVLLRVDSARVDRNNARTICAGSLQGLDISCCATSTSYPWPEWPVALSTASKFTPKSCALGRSIGACRRAGCRHCLPRPCPVLMASGLLTFPAVAGLSRRSTRTREARFPSTFLVHWHLDSLWRSCYAGEGSPLVASVAAVKPMRIMRAQRQEGETRCSASRGLCRSRKGLIAGVRKPRARHALRVLSRHFGVVCHSLIGTGVRTVRRSKQIGVQHGS